MDAQDDTDPDAGPVPLQDLIDELQLALILLAMRARDEAMTKRTQAGLVQE